MTETQANTNQYTFQRGYIIYYDNPKFLRELRRMPIRVTFISKKFQAIYCYSDERYENKLINLVKRSRGRAYIERAPLFDEKLNF